MFWGARWDGYLQCGHGGGEGWTVLHKRERISAGGLRKVLRGCVRWRQGVVNGFVGLGLFWEGNEKT